jgi:hypothetical protein
MKIPIHALLILAISILPAGPALTGQISEGPEKLLGLMTLLPEDDEIAGWKRSEKLLRASNEEELYRIFNGGASLYTQHGFRSFVGQSYKGPKGTELEVYIFDQGTSTTADDLYENPYTKPTRMKELTDLGEKARIDMTPLFASGVDFIQKGFFVRVMIQDKAEEGLNAALSFARSISRRIKGVTE